MSAPSWSDLETLFHEALGCAPADRAAFLAERCAGRPNLQAEVDALLRAHDNAPDDLDATRVTPHPQLQPGTRLGPYEVVAALGAGGMGEVYRARDTKLGRDVAIKILPDALHAATPSAWRGSSARRKTWRRSIIRTSARSTASKKSDGVRALVLELVEGADAGRARLRAGPAPRRPTRSAIARQIAEALEAAHEQGHHPPRPEARQHQDHAGRHRQGAGLRPGEGDVRQTDRRRIVPQSPTMTTPA